MTKIDNKHHLDGEQIVKTGNGVPINLNVEPVILFRGRDKLAVQMLEYYRQLCVVDGCNDFQLESLDVMLTKFRAFAKESATMKQPGVTRGL